MSAPRPDAHAILHPAAGASRFTVDWVEPHPELARIVGAHWTVRWDVGNEPYDQGVLAHPTVHVASELHLLETGSLRRAEVHGVVRGTFRRTLRGRGRVHGIKFRPGMFRGLLGRDVATLTGRVVDAATIMGDGWTELAHDAVDADDDRQAAHLLDTALRRRCEEPDAIALDLAELVEHVQVDRSITRADQLTELAGVSARTLQRSFARHVGVGPKWVVRTFRLQEAAGRLAAGDEVDLGSLAAELGYADQAHLTNDFRRAVGRTPARYAADQATATAHPARG